MDKAEKERLIRLYEEGYRKSPERQPELKALEKASLEVYTEEAAHKMSMEEARAMAEKWQKLLAATGKKFSDSTELLREDRER